MAAPCATMLPGGQQLHLQHGPIDLVVGVGGPNRESALCAAIARFETILQELVDELPILRAPVLATIPYGETAQRMFHATRPHAIFSFITPMAAVAGAVADEILAAIVSVGEIDKAYVNNGGDIALYLTRGENYQIAIAALNNRRLGKISITSENGIGGVATSGRSGRSLTMGIADSVTVLAKSAAMADVAATLIANAVDLSDHPAITRAPAHQIVPDSDLGHRSVVTHCERLNPTDIRRALDNGKHVAIKMKQAGLISGAALFLQGQSELLSFQPYQHTGKLLEYA